MNEASSDQWTPDELTDWSRSKTYVPLFPIARGGIGRVDLVIKRDGTFERLYAMKTLREHLRTEASFRKMFLSEARIAGLIRHANVVSVIDVGEGPDGPFLVMEYVEGITISQLIRGRTTEALLPIRLCLSIAKQVARGLHAAHELRSHDGLPLKLVHRDISPQNVLLSYDGTAKVTDFGIAKAQDQDHQTTQGVLKGKLGYMAPEQLRFEKPDRRTDLYSLGVVLFELLTGRRLFSGGVDGGAAQRILNDPTPDISEHRRDVPSALVALLFDLLSKEREHRPETASDVALQIEEILDELDEPVVSLESFLDEHFSETRADIKDKIRAALDQVRFDRDSEKDVHTEVDLPRPVIAQETLQKPPSRKRWILGALALFSCSLLAVYLMRATQPIETASSAPDPVEIQPSYPAAVPVQPQPEPEEPPTVMNLAADEPTEMTPRSSMRRRRRGSMRSMRRTPMSSMCPAGWWCPE